MVLLIKLFRVSELVVVRSRQSTSYCPLSFSLHEVVSNIRLCMVYFDTFKLLYCWAYYALPQWIMQAWKALEASTSKVRVYPMWHKLVLSAPFEANSSLDFHLEDT